MNKVAIRNLCDVAVFSAALAFDIFMAYRIGKKKGLMEISYDDDKYICGYIDGIKRLTIEYNENQELTEQFMAKYMNRIKAHLDPEDWVGDEDVCNHVFCYGDIFPLNIVEYHHMIKQK